MSFENFYPTYDIVKSLIHNEKDLELDKEKLLVISPDTGAMDRAIYYSSVLGVDVGLFYKRRDHSRIVNGKNPIVKHEYMGRDVDGKDVLIVDDIIDSGITMDFVINHVKSLGAKSVKTCTLLDKPSRRKVDLKPDYCCFEIEDLFVVGYGLNYGEHYRNIPYIFNWEK